MSAKTTKADKSRDGLRKQYDFSKGERGRYRPRLGTTATTVVLEPDLAERFPTSDAVNRVLRMVVELERIPGRKRARRAA